MKPVNNFKLNRERTVDLKKFGSKSTEFRYSHKEMLIVYIKMAMLGCALNQGKSGLL